MGLFNNIFEVARKTHEQNKSIQQEKDQQRKTKDSEEEVSKEVKRSAKVMVGNPEDDCCSKELYTIICSNQYNIESYEKNKDVNYDDYCPTLETYYCEYNGWTFDIVNVSDVDIDEGIFAVRNIKNRVTTEEVDFYCDLGCRNTSRARVEEFNDFLKHSSLEEYKSVKYDKYIRLPILLREKGFNVEECEYSFELNNPRGYLKLDKNLFVKIFHAWRDDFKTVVTNDNTWNVNSANNSDSTFGKKAYYFDYGSVDDVEELAKCIVAFKEEQSDKIGYIENATYYSNENIFDFFSTLRDKENFYKEAWNTYQIRIEHEGYWDQRGYDEENSVITNKYKGLEIYTKTTLKFNDASQWTIGDYANMSIIIFEYDKRKNPDLCRLKIENYIYQDREYQIYDEENECHVLDESKKVEEIEEYGTFTELMDMLKLYIYEMIKIHEVQT